MDSYEYNVPKFQDFCSGSDPAADSYFDNSNSSIIMEDKIQVDIPKGMAHKTPVKKNTDLENNDPNPTPEDIQTVIRAKPTSPVRRKILNELNASQEDNIRNEKTPKKELSETDILSENLNKLNITSTTKRRKKSPLRATQVFEGIELSASTRKTHRMTTRLDTATKTPMIDLRNRKVSRFRTYSNSSVSECEMSPKAASVASSTSTAHTISSQQPKKFIALAEQVDNYFYEPSDRFRSKPKFAHNMSQQTTQSRYIPKAPRLRTMARAREVHYIPREKRELDEWEEAQKHQVKAHPVNQKILEGTVLGLKTVIEKKPNTVQEPFNITQIKKKPVEEVKPFQFKAQPVPKKILESPQGIPPKKTLATTTPYTPHIRVPVRFRVDSASISKDVPDKPTISFTPKRTVLKPFSFEQREKDLFAKKEEKIKRLLEAEKKMASFKANPVRKFTSGTTRNGQEKPQTARFTVIQPFKLTEMPVKEHHVEEVKENHVPVFKARPPTVLKSKPFEPKKPENHFIKLIEPNFATDKRLPVRKEFDEKIKQAELKKQEEEKLAKEEEERRIQAEIAEQRKLAEFHARPIPKYKPIEIQPADPAKLTKPQSPIFRSGKSNMKKLAA